ncbi:MAG: LLM class flavin-dependent oxidoreductase [Gibbsiella quercinecans]|uniref:LLM class flavin-dependent oxidoreductase n=1 Tax=Gibbsiella quercinecans TaxID=929813 RepID=UPI003F3DF7C4
MCNRQIHLGLLAQPYGDHLAAWLNSSAPAGGATNIHYLQQLALTAEKGLFDLFFIADTPATCTENLHIHSRYPNYMNRLEPITELTAIAGMTRHIGLGATASTSFYEPYNLARLFASLDHLSKGRAAWNIVTSAKDYAARNFGLDKLPPHDARYARAREFYSIVASLWDTWEDDAFIYDKAECRYFDPDKYHITDFKGEYFKVYGGLNIQRTPQGRPVVIQAGSSEAGKALAAETAEVVFASDPTLEAAQRFYADLKGRMAQFGRHTDELKILAGLSVVVGDSEVEAQDKFQQLQDMIHPDVGKMRLSADLEADLSSLPLDEPIPVEMIPKKANFHQAYFNQLAEMIREQRLTLRQLYSSYERGKVSLCGTPAMIADHMMTWMESDAADGFMLSFHTLPDDLQDFVSKVVPVLQARGVYRQQYQGNTLREHLNLLRPANRHVAAGDKR